MDHKCSWPRSAAAIAVLIALSVTARATFPGQNGKIAFDGATDIFTVNPDGASVEQLTAFGPNGFAGAPAWSSDGKQLAFAAFPPSSPSQLWIMNADGSKQRQFFVDPEGFADNYPSFSPDGSQVVFTRCGVVNCAIYRVRTDGTGLTAITQFDPNPDVNDYFPEYSPDGNAIAFTSFARGGVICAVYLVKWDGSNLRRLTPPELEAFFPDWSPDGQTLVFTTRAAYPPNSINPQLWTMDVNGNYLQQITNPGQAADIVSSWSPEGDAIAFERDLPDGTAGIFVIKADGNGLHQVIGMPQSRSRIFAGSDQGRRLHGANGPPKEIEAGGTFPRWGSAR